MTLLARVWPNGEFAIAVRRKAKVQAIKKVRSRIIRPTVPSEGIQNPEVENWRVKTVLTEEELKIQQSEYYRTPQKPARALGLSDVSKNPTRAERGQKGLTSYGRKMLRNGAWMLSRKCPRYSLAMITLTLPSMAVEDERAAINNWSEIMRQFNKWLSRRLKAAGACPWIVGCCEIQEKRQAVYGGLPLHAHLLINSKVGNTYVFSPSEIRVKWKEIVLRVMNAQTSYNWDSSTRLETVKKDAENYIAKYISKGITNPSGMLLENGMICPHNWWYGFGGVKDAVKKAVRYLNDDDANFLHWIWRNANEALVYRFDVVIDMDRTNVPVAWVGKLNHRGWDMLRAVWFRNAVPRSL